MTGSSSSLTSLASSPHVGLTPAVQRLLAALEEIVAEGSTADPRQCAALLTASARVQGLSLREVAAVDAGATFVEVGLHSTRELVQSTTRVTADSASATVHLARNLAGVLEPVRDLVLTGQATAEHGAAVSSGVRKLSPDIVERAIGPIRALTLAADPTTIRRELRERALALSPELAEEQRRRLHERRTASLDESPDGAGHLHAVLSPEQRALLTAVLSGKVHAERTAGDTRNAGQRRIDALVEVFHHAATCTGLDLPTQSGANRAQITILATAGTVLDLTGSAPARIVGSTAGFLTRTQLLRLSCDADISTLHLAGDGTIDKLDLSRLSRTVTPAQRRFLEARDQHCAVRGCGTPPAGCQAHHAKHWANGGNTDVDNLVLLCHHHHHDIHDRGKQLPCTNGRWLTPDGWLDQNQLLFTT